MVSFTFLLKSPSVAYVKMENSEVKALASPPNPPQVWCWYVDDTFILHHQYAIEEFTNHINSLDPHIKFTMEDEHDGQLPFLDTCILVNEDGSLKTKIYRKPTHTDQFLNWDSNQHIDHKRSVIHTLLRRVEQVVSEP